jgi:hypothetical protein
MKEIKKEKTRCTCGRMNGVAGKCDKCGGYGYDVTIEVPKFATPDVEEDLTNTEIGDIILSQENAIALLEKEIIKKQLCVAHYKKFLK